MIITEKGRRDASANDTRAGLLTNAIAALYVKRIPQAVVEEHVRRVVAACLVECENIPDLAAFYKENAALIEPIVRDTIEGALAAGKVAFGA